MKNLLKVALAFALVGTVGCSKKAPRCDDVFEHTKSLAPAELQKMFENKKDSAIEKCNKMSDEAKQCAMDAKSMEELQKCPRA